MKNIDPKAGILSQSAADIGLNSLSMLLEWVQNLPYGRNSDRANYHLPFTEKKGSCSTKHALVKAIALENDWPGIDLCLGFFSMNGLNTPAVAATLAEHYLNAIPEAHTFLRIDGHYTDLTGAQLLISETDIEDEMEIEPEDIGLLKEVMHRGRIAEWKEDEHISLSNEEIWKVREKCIAVLAKHA